MEFTVLIMFFFKCNLVSQKDKNTLFSAWSSTSVCLDLKKLSVVMTLLRKCSRLKYTYNHQNHRIAQGGRDLQDQVQLQPNDTTLTLTTFLSRSYLQICIHGRVLLQNKLSHQIFFTEPYVRNTQQYFQGKKPHILRYGAFLIEHCQ